jgi:flagellar basal-body rod modification protein FlgD
MNINTTTTNSSQTSAAQATLDRLNRPSTLTGGGLDSLDGGDFLRLMTAQLTFQDPLSPTDNQDMLAQMAQFSALAATTESGATLEDIAAKLDRLIEAQEAAARAASAAPVTPAP